MVRAVSFRAEQLGSCKRNLAEGTRYAPSLSNTPQRRTSLALALWAPYTKEEEEEEEEEWGV